MRIDLYGVCVHSFIINFATNLEPLMFDLLPNSHLEKKIHEKIVLQRTDMNKQKLTAFDLLKKKKKTLVPNNG